MNSLCIPRAMTYTTANDVEGVFNSLFGRSVMRVDERTTSDRAGEEFKMFYIHFMPVHPQTGLTPAMVSFNEKLERDGVVHVMTGRGKWFWKVYKNKSTKAEQPVRKGPRVMTEEDEQLFLQWKETRNQAAAAEPEVATPVFTEEELDELNDAIGNFNEEELDELDSEHGAATTDLDEKELLAIADEMAKE
jgi:hypothetical protein